MVRQFLARSPNTTTKWHSNVHSQPRQLGFAGGVGVSTLPVRNALLQLVQSPRLMSADRLAGQTERSVRLTSPGFPGYLAGCSSASPQVMPARPIIQVPYLEPANRTRGGLISVQPRLPLITVNPGSVCLSDCLRISVRTTTVRGIERSLLTQKPYSSAPIRRT